MRTEKVRYRIRKRLNTMHLAVAEAERRAGLAKNYLDDFLSDRKKSMKPDAFQSIATVLKTSDDWLLAGKEPEVIDGDEIAISTSLNVLRRITEGDESVKITHVGKRETKEVVFLSMNIETGECTFREISEGAEIHHGTIIDPAINLARNVYVRGFMMHHPVKVILKRITLDNETGKTVIVDDWEAEK